MLVPNAVSSEGPGRPLDWILPKTLRYPGRMDWAEGGVQNRAWGLPGRFARSLGPEGWALGSWQREPSPSVLLGDHWFPSVPFGDPESPLEDSGSSLVWGSECWEQGRVMGSRFRCCNPGILVRFSDPLA